MEEDFPEALDQTNEQRRERQALSLRATLQRLFEGEHLPGPLTRLDVPPPKKDLPYGGHSAYLVLDDRTKKNSLLTSG